MILEAEINGKLEKFDLFRFAREVLGYDLLQEDPHRRWCNQAGQHYKRSLYLKPRVTYKSTIYTIADSIFRLLENPNLRILIANATIDQAQQFLNEIAGHYKRNDRLRELHYEMYNCEALDYRSSVSEKLTLNSRTSIRKEPSIATIGALGNIVSSHYDIIKVDDLCNIQDRESPSIREKKKRWFNDLIAILEREPPGELQVVGCLTADTKILKSDGTWTDIINIKSGDMVFTFDSGKLATKRVNGMMPQKVDAIYEIKTKNTTVRANARHPFLVIRPTARWNSKRLLLTDIEYTWVPASELKKDDYVVSIAQTPTGSEAIELQDGSTYNSSNEFAWLMGFMTGDGWVVAHRKDYIIEFAMGIDEPQNSRVIEAFKSLFGLNPAKIDLIKRKVTYNSNKVGKLFKALSFKHGAKNKDIPAWVFKLPLLHRCEFIKGLLAADGHKDKVGYGNSIEVSSKKLIDDLRLLAMISDYRPSNIYERTRYIKAPNSPREVEAHTYHIRLWPDASAKNRSTFYLAAKPKLPGEHFGLQRIVSVTACGEEMVYDLSIEGTHNFIADGLVVHNTRWADQDCYDYIINTVNPKLPEVDKYFIDIEPCWLDDGITPRFPNLLSQERLNTLKIEMGILVFSCQEELQPLSSEHTLFKLENLHTIKHKDIDIMQCERYGGLDMSKGGEDLSAIVSVCKTPDNKILVFHSDLANEPPSEALKKVVKLQKLFNYTKFWIEMNSTDISKAAWQAGERSSMEILLKMEQEKEGVVVPYAPVWNSQNKQTRISSMEPHYTNGLLIFWDTYLQDYSECITQLTRFPMGHDDFCFAKGTKIATPRGDKEIQDLKIGDLVITPSGAKKITNCGITGFNPVINKIGLIGTKNHPVFVDQQGFIPLMYISNTSEVNILCLKNQMRWAYLRSLYSTELSTDSWAQDDIILASQLLTQDEGELKDFIRRFMSFMAAKQFKKVVSFTTKTAIHSTTNIAILSAYHISNMLSSMKGIKTRKSEKHSFYLSRIKRRLGTNLQMVENGIGSILKSFGISPISNISASNAERNLNQEQNEHSFVRFIVDSSEEKKPDSSSLGQIVLFAERNLRLISSHVKNRDQHVQQNVPPHLDLELVYNLTVEGEHVYFANNILVSNCDCLEICLSNLINVPKPGRKISFSTPKNPTVGGNLF
jgi:predicted phage terminase large subunit-like protein